MAPSSIWDRAALLIKSVEAHRHGATIQEICDWCERHTIDRMPPSTARDILEGLRRINMLTRKLPKTSRAI